MFPAEEFTPIDNLPYREDLCPYVHFFLGSCKSAVKLLKNVLPSWSEVSEVYYSNTRIHLLCVEFRKVGHVLSETVRVFLTRRRLWGHEQMTYQLQIRT